MFKRQGITAIFRRIMRNRLARFGFVFLLLLFIVALFADKIAPYSYKKQFLSHILELPSKQFLFGTDELGRDILSRLIYGARVSLSVGFFAVGIALVLGGILGSISGYYGGRLDHVIMRFLDIVMSLPGMLLAIVITATLGPGLFNLMIAIGISQMPRFARIIRSSVMSIKDNDFIEAAHAMGVADPVIILRHILPNSMAPIIVHSTLSVAVAILTAAALSFIGLGIQPPYPEWGNMLSGGRHFIRVSPHLAFFPGFAIMLTILSLNFLGDGLRDALDPKLKN